MKLSKSSGVWTQEEEAEIEVLAEVLAGQLGADNVEAEFALVVLESLFSTYTIL